MPAPGLLPRFFDRVMRRAFGDLGLDDGPVVAYLAELCTRFARAEALERIEALPGRRLGTIVDALLEIQKVWEAPETDFDPRRERTLRRHVGDVALFMSGLFPEHVARLGVADHYRLEGERAYRFVAELARAGGEQDAPLYRRLADRFEHFAGALTYMRKVYFRPDQLPAGLRPDDPLWRRLIA